MNKARREKITKLHQQLDDIKSEIETIADEEQEYYDNMPESLQNGDKGETANEAITALQDAVNNVDAAMDNLDSIQ